MNEADIMTARAFADAARRETHTFCREPFHGGGQVVHPKTNVVEGGLVHARSGLRIDGLHEIDLNTGRTYAGHQNVLVDILLLAAVFARLFYTQQIAPKRAEFTLIGSADGDLLQTKNTERTLVTHVMPWFYQRGRDAIDYRRGIKML